ncbi:ArsR/SmtB family transcription factor [Apilactobacillus micheneri]|uniref:ArsR family transcriptional regulator n=1 Tax=Apilactobacillus micheneri TaxID=1899430 RepID=A0A9Q8ILG8_9LACO|nr:metalloregulator ArsR/SmtB family transcription factor [Apilactobacillus micheneri]TPR26266.1 ArsR family transcriptional regulator [Apilactobacillus micheneri]TPR27020.1 ArsR family transcriptional regulator [Apilactobacillus micheneri]TPR27878.1 ArsR family transcriptional regulator [Apilactobacillus micheneri]TPR31783.1 ArsR family transcriptional regulator [Apilactobacillus micheneri]TPR32187.1 ArsR family transcriptional regulator [Apilactobacillus micheneri]
MNINEQKLHMITKALDNSTRIKMLYYLAENNSSNVSNLINVFNISQPNISRHLKILADANLVFSTKDGKERIYQLSDKHVYQLLLTLKTHIND